MPEPAQSLILCALPFERATMRRLGVDASRLLPPCGPGRAAVERWFDSAGDRLRPGATVVMAGLGGGLDAPRRVGSAWIASVVVDARTGVRRVPTWMPQHTDDARGCVVASTDRSVTTADEKRRLGRALDAGLVDRESSTFAALASAAGLDWGVVRGVSDDVATSLPRRVDDWLDAAGSPRLLAIAGSVVQRPGVLVPMLRLRRASIAALHAVAALLGIESGNGAA